MRWPNDPIRAKGRPNMATKELNRVPPAKSCHIFKDTSNTLGFCCSMAQATGHVMPADPSNLCWRLTCVWHKKSCWSWYICEGPQHSASRLVKITDMPDQYNIQLPTYNECAGMVNARAPSFQSLSLSCILLIYISLLASSGNRGCFEIPLVYQEWFLKKSFCEIRLYSIA